MAKKSIFDRAQALRTGSRPARSTPAGGAGDKGTQARRSVRRRAGAPEPVAEPEVKEVTPEAAAKPRVVRRRGAPAPAPDPEPIAAPVAVEAAAPEPEPVPEPVVAVAPEPAPEPEPVVAAAPEPEPAPEPVAEAAPEQPAEPESAAAAEAPADPAAEGESGEEPPSIEDLLSTPRRKRKHKVLSDEEVEAEKAPANEPEAVEAPEPAPLPMAAVAAAAASGELAAAAIASVVTEQPVSLEDLLRDQGIVQHVPKKGRRIIEDDISRQIKEGPPVRPAPAAAAPATPGGLAAEPKRNKPVRFLDPNAIMKEREAKGNAKKKGKSIVSRRDALYGAPDRRRRKGRKTRGSGMQTELTTPAAHKRIVDVDGTITISDLAHGLGVKAHGLVKMLVGMGQLLTVNESVDVETATLLAEEFDFEVRDASFKEDEIIERDQEPATDANQEPRAPVVTIMGHVDHGKTTLLDAIRNAKVADGEAGGITQHISAFDVVAGGNRIVFIDTPGHEAFTAMRARGAQITDIVVLVVAATEGVRPQTLEVISHAKAADVPIIVAINKIDLPESNPDRCRNELSEHELIPEDWGGDVQMIEVSAKEKLGIDDLLEAINLQAELMELTANPSRSAQGHVIEAQQEKGRGPVATILVERGTIKPRDIIVAGFEFGRVRALLNPDGKKLKKAGPSTPLSVLGLGGLPGAGDEWVIVASENDAKKLVENRKAIARRERESNSGLKMEDVYRRMQEGNIKELNLIVKADVQGSIEALKKVFSEIVVRDTRVKILHATVGGITEGDIQLANASEAIVLGFGVRPDANARRAAESTGVEVRTYRVIYEAVDEVKAALVGLLDPEFVEKVMGHAEVRETFKIPKIGMVCGCSVQDGKLGRNHKARLLRASVVIWEGALGSLRRFKDDVKEVLVGYECGVGLEGYDDVKVGDIIETFIVEEIRPTI